MTAVSHSETQGQDEATLAYYTPIRFVIPLLAQGEAATHFSAELELSVFFFWVDSWNN